MKIILLRHGEPDFRRKWVRSAEEAKLALELYSRSRVTSTNHDQLTESTPFANVCVSSNLARAIDTAVHLGFENSKQLDLFNESELPCPDSLYLPLPWRVFLIVYRTLWFFGFKKNCPGREKDSERARLASQYLENLASKNLVVVLVGHGIMNRLISAELKNSGWRVSARSGNGYWSSTTLLRRDSESK